VWPAWLERSRTWMLLTAQGTFTSGNAKKGGSQRGAPKEMLVTRTVDVNAQAVRVEIPQQSP
jgi:hypothetical protein